MHEATFEEVSKRIKRHLEERDWHHNPNRSLAISVSLEAAELLEHYQWGEDAVGEKEDIASELADILIYTFQIAHNERIDLAAAIIGKLEKTSKKYPAKDFKGKNSEEQNIAWMQNKLRHKKDGL